MTVRNFAAELAYHVYHYHMMKVNLAYLVRRKSVTWQAFKSSVQWRMWSELTEDERGAWEAVADALLKPPQDGGELVARLDAIARDMED